MFFHRSRFVNSRRAVGRRRASSRSVFIDLVGARIRLGVGLQRELVFVELIGRINPIKSDLDSIRIQSCRRRAAFKLNRAADIAGYVRRAFNRPELEPLIVRESANPGIYITRRALASCVVEGPELAPMSAASNDLFHDDDNDDDMRIDAIFSFVYQRRRVLSFFRVHMSGGKS